MDRSDVLLKEGNDIIKALQIAYRSEGRTQVPEVIIGLLQDADTLRQKRSIREALGCCQDAYSLTIDPDWRNSPNVAINMEYAEGLVLTYLGTIYLARGKQELPTALRQFDEAGRVFQNCNKHYSQAVAFMAQGKVYEIENKWLEAMKYYELSLQAFSPFDPRDQALFQLRQSIIRCSQKCSSAYQPPSAMANSIPISASCHLRKKHDSDPFEGLWLPFVNLVDALVILEPEPDIKSDLMALKERFISTRDLIGKESWHQDWNPLIHSLKQLQQQSPRNARITMQELRAQVSKLIDRLLKVLPLDKDFEDIKTQLQEIATQLERR